MAILGNEKQIVEEPVLSPSRVVSGRGLYLDKSNDNHVRPVPVKCLSAACHQSEDTS